MARRDLTSFWLYRYRFIIGYGLIVAILAALLVFAGLYVPGGLSEFEKTALITTASIDFTDPASLLIVNLPFHAFQAGILNLFGIYDFTIKLPSLILGLVAALGMIYLLRRWFPTSIAILASMIAVTTGQFLLVAQSGSGSILYIFWPVILLLLGTQVTRAGRWRFFWKICFTIAAALSLYTPLSIYTLLAVAITVILHPHLRMAVKRLSKFRLSVCLVIACVLLAPLALTIIQQPTEGLRLLGLPEEAPDLWANFQLLVTQYFMFWEPNATSVLTPVFGLGSMLVIGLGLYRLIRTRDTTRSYLVMIWILCLAPILIISPQYVTIVFLPSVLLLAAGLTSLIGYWYRLFPLNPYARVAGLVPIIVLVSVLIGSGIDRYVYGYHYSPTIASNYSKDLKLLPSDTRLLVVSEAEKPFFDAVATFRDDLSVTTTAPTNDSFIATREARRAVPDDQIITSITANQFREEADRFYRYEPSVQ